MSFKCKGCLEKFERESSFILHLRTTGDRRCTTTRDEILGKLRAKPGRKQARKPSAKPPASPENHAESELNSPGPLTFEGDFFGDDYQDEDFPYPEPETVDLEGIATRQVVVEDSDDSDGSDDEGYEGFVPTGASPVGQAPTEPPTQTQHTTDESEAMAVDEPVEGSSSASADIEQPANPTAPGGIPIESHDRLRSAAAHVTQFGGRAGRTFTGAESQLPEGASGYTKYAEDLGGIPGMTQGSEWAPFASLMEWEIARWAKLRGQGSTAFSDLLKINGIVEALGLSFKSSAELNKIIDNKLPSRRPVFKKLEAVVGGESFDIYLRDVIKCIKALFGDPQHVDYLVFSPERHYADADKTIRLYFDMHTGEWWWSTQKALEKDKPGATIVPVIISSDKTQITLFRNKTAYPVYLTIGNLPKTIRRKPSRQGQILLAYLPTTRLLQITNKAACRRTQANLFHACMSNILAPLKEAGLDGIFMASGDGVTRRCHPILASYVGDYPEQCLVTGVFSGDCPECDCPHDELGDHPGIYPLHDLDTILDALDQLGQTHFAEACRSANIKPLQNPFWKDLPYLHIFQSITPNILHQLHQGVIKHLISWLKQACGAATIDQHVQRLPPNHAIRIFSKGISGLSRVSGTEHRQISSFLLGLLIDIQLPNGVSPKPLIRATRALLDFLYLAQYPVHTSETLKALDSALEDFHANKFIFETLGIRSNFNIPKLHFLLHYIHAIKLFGTTDNYNTESTERLHIDFAKEAYQATNHKDEFDQMTKWLERKEKILHHSNFIQWRRDRQHIATVDKSTTPTRSRWQPPDMASTFAIKMTKHPTRRSVSVSEITSVAGYGAIHFSVALSRFIAQFRQPSLSRRQLEAEADEVYLPFTAVPVYHRVKFWNEEFFGNETLDSIHACCAQRKKDGSLSAPRFDTALALLEKGGSEGTRGLSGMRVGQVRVVFSLPEDSLAGLFPSRNYPPQHLAYIEWFSKFSARPDPDLKLFKILRSYSDAATNERLVSVIPVSLLQRSIHLYPKWGRDSDIVASWTSDSVLDECKTFYVNSFKDRHSYYNVY